MMKEKMPGAKAEAVDELALGQRFKRCSGVSDHTACQRSLHCDRRVIELTADDIGVGRRRLLLGDGHWAAAKSGSPGERGGSCRRLAGRRCSVGEFAPWKSVG
jgi:hypothetical protein